MAHGMRPVVLRRAVSNTAEGGEPGPRVAGAGEEGTVSGTSGTTDVEGPRRADAEG